MGFFKLYCVNSEFVFTIERTKDIGRQTEYKQIVQDSFCTRVWTKCDR